jgi:D-alanyl-D-alanine carboxypeptidase/D-alanyl-D-alanine-endopeptidase (penicillin-binding protein 4)
MPRVLLTLVVLAATIWGAAPATAATRFTDADLKTAIKREMRSAPAASGVYVRDMDSGAELFAMREDAVRIPASVEKLFTTATALLRMGPDATLRTLAVMAPDAVVANGTLRGDLVLVGDGDPFFGDVAAAKLARSIRAAGIRRITGSVVGDESAFDTKRSGCCTSYDSDLGGVLSALAYDRGIYRGRARLDAPRFAAAHFAAQLKAAGVRAAGKSRAGRAPDGATTVAFAESMPVSELIRYINVPSNNFAAEMLFRDLGARFSDRGSRSRGVRVVRTTLDDFGVRPKIVDGSGLSRSDRTTPREVVRLLDRMDEPDVATAFRASLAVAGRTGTVKARMRGTPAAGRCSVKTGTLRLVSGLAGYCRTAGGREIGFSIMSNRANTYAAKAREDRIAAAIARLSGSPATPPPGATTTAGGGSSAP